VTDGDIEIAPQRATTQRGHAAEPACEQRGFEWMEYIFVNLVEKECVLKNINGKVIIVHGQGLSLLLV
jgi:hypothetical protein